MITIIIPVYNAESTLKQCVDSILAQEYKDFELLLIDDGSKDESPAICDEYSNSDSRVRVFHKENGGVSSARNLGLDNARGEWITFIDSDDYIEPDYVLEINTESDLLIMRMTDSIKTNSTKRVTVSNSSRCDLYNDELSSYIKKYVSSMIFRVPWGKYYKRILIGNLRFHEDMTVAEDACFVMDYISRIRQISLVQNGAYVFRISPLPNHIKYALPIESSIQSLNHLCEAYKKVDRSFNIGHEGFYSFLGFFKMVSEAEWKKDPRKWYGNRSVKEFYKFVWPSLSLKQKFILISAYVLRK